jgi:formyltetrahydrofolate deformylase
LLQRFVITLSCPDRRGIVAAVAGYLCERACNIVDSQQFDDRRNRRFFMRVTFESEADAAYAELEGGFADIAERFAMDWQIFDLAVRPRALLMVSKFGHCLNDLLYRISIGSLPIEVPAVISNHNDLEPLAKAHGIPFLHMPVTPESKAQAERQLLEMVVRERCDFVVLARYMQVLSHQFCETLPGQVINIHHSFLPSFKGARPYHQAHARGVKLIGATAHYVTTDLDEGPIIEQQTIRVDHRLSPDAYVSAGRDVEAQVLARAVLWHAEHRILLNGRTTVVFR